MLELVLAGIAAWAKAAERFYAYRSQILSLLPEDQQKAEAAKAVAILAPAEDLLVKFSHVLSFAIDKIPDLKLPPVP